jgi:hypothetical protein
LPARFDPHAKQAEAKQARHQHQSRTLQHGCPPIWVPSHGGAPRSG